LVPQGPFLANYASKGENVEFDILSLMTWV
jgi:hypothetical protein